MKRVIFFLLCFLISQVPAFAAPDLQMQVQELKQMVQELRQTVNRQQDEIDTLKSASTAAMPPEAAPPSTQPQPISASSGKWNPDIGVIADTLFKLDSPKDDTSGADRLSVRELELVIGSYVDPFSRMDVNIAFSDLDEAELSEAYLTRFGLPWETTARVGRFKPKFGKAPMYHRDILDTVDEPLAVVRYFGEEGLNKTGIDFTKPLDLPLDSSHEIVVGVLEGGVGEGGNALGTTRRRPTVYSHLRNFWDLADVTTYELGLSHMIGSQDEDASLEVNILGIDSTLIHLAGPDQRIKWQSELFIVDRDQTTPGLEDTTLGAYSVFDYRFSKQWSAGARVDYVELIDNPLTNPEDSDYGYTGYVTFYQTDFARWRLQLNHWELASGKDDNQVMIQGIFAIGDHKHKLQ